MLSSWVVLRSDCKVLGVVYSSDSGASIPRRHVMLCHDADFRMLSLGTRQNKLAVPA